MNTWQKGTGSIPRNVCRNERIFSAVAGSLLLCMLMKKNKNAGLMAAAGGYLLFKGISGYSPLSAFRDRMRTPAGRNINVHMQLVVNCPREEVYRFWRDLENMNLFMEHVESVQELDEKTSRWMVKIPGGWGVLEWEARIVREEEGREISWTSLPGAAIDNSGKISFSDSPGNGTRIDALISYKAPLGIAGDKLSRFLTPLLKAKIEEDIWNFKYYMENRQAMNKNSLV